MNNRNMPAQNITYKGKTYLLSSLCTRRDLFLFSTILFLIFSFVCFCGPETRHMGIFFCVLAITCLALFFHYLYIIKKCKPTTVTDYPENQFQQMRTLSDPITLTFRLKGTSFIQDNLYRFIYSFKPKPAELRPEPQNQYDPNAIAVYVDNVFVGHVPRKLCTRVKNIMDKNIITNVSAEFFLASNSDKDDDEYIWGKCYIRYVKVSDGRTSNKS